MKISDVKVDIVNWKSQGWKTGVGTMFGQDQPQMEGSSHEN